MIKTASEDFLLRSWKGADKSFECIHWKIHLMNLCATLVDLGVGERITNSLSSLPSNNLYLGGDMVDMETKK